jgi:hypothetical protein
MLPLWYAVLSALVVIGVSRLLEARRQWPVFVLGAAIALVPFLVGDRPAACRGDAGSGGPFEYDLCHQYFRDRYHPEQVLSVWAEVGDPSVPVVTSFEGYYSLAVLKSPARIFEYRRFTPSAAQPPMLVAHDQDEARTMIAALRLGEREYSLVADTGYFKVYWPTR